MTKKQARNQVRRALGEGRDRFKVHAYREHDRCVLVVHRCSGQPTERGVRRLVAIAPDWAHAARQARCGFLVAP